MEAATISTPLFQIRYCLPVVDDVKNLQPDETDEFTASAGAAEGYKWIRNGVSAAESLAG